MRNSPEIAKIIQPYENGSPDQRQPERRRDPRWAYSVTQLVAFHNEFDQPTKDQLQAVQCRDISKGGISVILSRPPAHTHCTLVLGRQPGLIFVKARVAHCQPVSATNDQWQVGCEFVAKLDAFPLRTL